MALAAVLKRHKRFVAAAQLDDGVGAPLSKAADVAADATKILRDLPVAGLEGAAGLRPLADAVAAFFQHLAKLRAARHYPVARAAKLVEAASAALGATSAKLVDERGVLGETVDDGVWDDAAAVFGAARVGCRKFRELALELGRRGGDLERLAKLELPHERVERRCDAVRRFRGDHDAFRATLRAVLEHGGAADGSLALAELDGAFARVREELRESGCCDASFEGEARWAAATADYSKRVQRAETMAATRMAADLDRASSADEVFGVFSAFRPLLDRAPVRRAAQRRQAELVDAVGRAVGELKDACTKRYEGGRAASLARHRDLPPLGGKVAWARQVERRLETQMERLQAVLGGGDAVDRHPRGRALKTTSDELLRHLDARPLYDAWLARWKKNCAAGETSSDTLLLRVRFRKDGAARLAVNFEADRVELFKEVAQLRWLGYRVPETIALVADEARERYPAAVALRAACRAYRRPRRKSWPLDLAYFKRTA